MCLLGNQFPKVFIFPLEIDFFNNKKKESNRLVYHQTKTTTTTKYSIYIDQSYKKLKQEKNPGIKFRINQPEKKVKKIQANKSCLFVCLN